jgi:hypothetical protein
MKSFQFFIFIFFIKLSISDTPRKLAQIESTKEQENVDTPLVFSELFANLKSEWINSMGDFVSQYLVIVPVPYKKPVDFFENVTQVPCSMRGAFFLEEANSEKDVIDFSILAPNNTVIFHSVSFGAIFNLNLTEKGLYTIIFNNRAMSREVKPTFIMNAGQNLIVEKEKLSASEQKLDNLFSIFKRFDQETKLNRGFTRKGDKLLSSTNTYFYIFSLLETIVLIGVSAWQYYYLKHLFEVKGSL